MRTTAEIIAEIDKRLVLLEPWQDKEVQMVCVELADLKKWIKKK